MIETNIPFSSGATGTGPVVERLLQALPGMSPQLRKAAGYILDNPRVVGVNSIREVAEAAGVKPNTLVRMARAAGCDGYDDFRKPFRDALRELPAAIRYLADQAESGGDQREKQTAEIRKIRLELVALHRQRMRLTAAIVLVSAAALVLTMLAVY